MRQKKGQREREMGGRRNYAETVDLGFRRKDRKRKGNHSEVEGRDRGRKNEKGKVKEDGIDKKE